MNYGFYPNQTVVPQRNFNYQNTSPQNNINSIELQNTNFQQKVSLIKLETENKALKEKMLELNNSLNDLNFKVENKKGENIKGSKEYEQLIKDFKNRVR